MASGWRIATLILLLMAAAPVAAQQPSSQPVENCLPGTSCYARLQSIEALGARTADIAREVERLAKRDPQLVLLAAQLSTLQVHVQELNALIKARQPASTENLDRILDDLVRVRSMINLGDERFADFGPLLAALDDLVDTARKARDSAPEMTPGNVDELAQAVSSLAEKVGSLPPPSHEVKDPESVPVGRAAPKISAKDNLVAIYGDDARFHVAVMAVPDPRIPRYRRSFDLTIEATMRAMSAHGAHLDRFHFPWAPPQAMSCRDASNTQSDCVKDGYGDLGIITFRKDCRHVESKQNDRLCAAGSTVHVVAVYLVPERGTDGPDQLAAHDALGKLPPGFCGSQPPGGATARIPATVGVPVLHSALIAPLSSSSFGPWEGALRTARACPDRIGLLAQRPAAAKALDSAATAASVVASTVLGRGTLAAISSVVRKLQTDVFPIAWISPTATALSTERSKDGLIREMRVVAVEDAERLHRLYGHLGGSAVDVLAENSRYGDLPEHVAAAPTGTVVRFNPGLWELQSSTQKPDAGNARLRFERRFARELVFDEKDRGNELPPRYAGTVGARTQELAFERIMQDFSSQRRRGDATRPALIVASDVRDQLVVARAVRVAEPDAQLVFFDADELLAHPAYVSATRGALVVPAGRLVQCGADGNLHRFAKDEMALVFRAVHLWLNSGDDHEARCPGWTAAPAMSQLMVVTRSGLREKNELPGLRSREVMPKVALATALAVFAIWSILGGVGPTRQFVVDRSVTRQVGAIVLACVAFAWMQAVPGFPVVFEHIGEGVSLATAWVVVIIGILLAAIATSVVWAATVNRERTPLLDPALLPPPPKAHAAILVMVALYVTHLLSTNTTLFLGTGGPTLGDGGCALRYVPWLAELLGLFSVIALGMAYRGWMMLRRDIALCDIRYSKEFAQTWVGSIALPPIATPYLATHDRNLDELAWRSTSMQGVANRRRILASDITGIRAWLHGDIAVCVLGILAVQAFPMVGHARLLQVFLFSGLACVGFLLMLLVGMARNELLNALFTGKDRLEFGPRFITLIATATLFGAGLVYLATAPDGSDWYDGLFVPLLSLLRL